MTIVSKYSVFIFWKVEFWYVYVFDTYVCIVYRDDAANLRSHSSSCFSETCEVGSYFLNKLPEGTVKNDLSTKADLARVRSFLVEKAFNDREEFNQ